MQEGEDANHACLVGVPQKPAGLSFASGNHPRHRQIRRDRRQVQQGCALEIDNMPILRRIGDFQHVLRTTRFDMEVEISLAGKLAHAPVDPENIARDDLRLGA